MRGFILSGFENYARRRWGCGLAKEGGTGPDDRGTKRPRSWDHVAFEDFWSRVEQLSQQAGVAPGDLLRDYGREMFQTLVHLPLRRPLIDDVFQFLQSMETEVFPELDELVGELNLPTLGCQRLSRHSLELVYVSPRQLGDLAEGLLLGSIAHFQKPVRLQRRNDPRDPDRVTFVLTRN